MAQSNAGFVSPPQPGDEMSFSARDLLTRLVREDGAIRGRITNLSEPLWFHLGSCPEIAVQIADVRELLHHGLIEFWKDWIQPREELYRASETGRERAGKNAIADAAKSATNYVYHKQSAGRRPRALRPMGGKYALGKPIVAVQVGTTETTTLPTAASVEIQQNAQTALVQVKWQQRYFVMHLSDLLDVCRIEDVGRITWPDGFGSS
jgi:hypothetical protein